MQPHHPEPQSIPSSLVAELEPMLLRYARRRVHSDELARDLVQETWLAAIGSYSRYAGRSTFRTWVTAILRRKIADTYRYRRPTVALTEGHHALSVGGDVLPRHVEARERVHAVMEAMDRLTPREREAVELCGVEELDREEAAERMGLSRPCLRVTLCRGRKRLRDAVEHEEH